MTNKICNVCIKQTESIEEIGPFGPHYGRLNCSECGKFKQWLMNPINIELRNKLSAYFESKKDTKNVFTKSLHKYFLIKGKLTAKQMKFIKI